MHTTLGQHKITLMCVCVMWVNTVPRVNNCKQNYTDVCLCHVGEHGA